MRCSLVTDSIFLLCFLAFQTYCFAMETEFEGLETSSADMLFLLTKKLAKITYLFFFFSYNVNSTLN